MLLSWPQRLDLFFTNFIRGGAIFNDDTVLNQLTLADDDGLHGSDIRTALSIICSNSPESINFCKDTQVLRAALENRVATSFSNPLLLAGLYSTLSNHKRFDAHVKAIFGNGIDHIVDFSTVSANLSADMI